MKNIKVWDPKPKKVWKGLKNYYTRLTKAELINRLIYLQAENWEMRFEESQKRIFVSPEIMEQIKKELE